MRKTGERTNRICIIRSNSVKPDSRVEKEAWTLQKAGYDVHILAWNREDDTYEKKEFIEVAGERIPITRLGHKASYGEGMKNIRAYLSFQFHMRRWLRKKRFDVIHACDFDTAFFSYKIAKKRREKFVFDIFDFLCGEPKNLIQRCIKKAQIKIINNSNITIICSEERINQIKGSKPQKLIVVHNTPMRMQLNYEKMICDITDKVKVAYVGILQDYRLLKEICEVISSSNEIELHIGGFGKYESYFKEASDKFDNIKFYGRLTYEQTLALENACDVMLAIYDPLIENHRYAAPNKFYESLMLGKPIMMVRGTGMSYIVEEKRFGVLIDYSKDGFLQGINQLIFQRKSWEKIGEDMRELYQREYSWERMNDRILEAYDELFM